MFWHVMIIIFGDVWYVSFAKKMDEIIFVICSIYEFKEKMPIFETKNEGNKFTMAYIFFHTNNVRNNVRFFLISAFFFLKLMSEKIFLRIFFRCAHINVSGEFCGHRFSYFLAKLIHSRDIFS
jgi:hypothetical protein